MKPNKRFIVETQGETSLFCNARTIEVKVNSGIFESMSRGATEVKMLDNDTYAEFDEKTHIVKRGWRTQFFGNKGIEKREIIKEIKGGTEVFSKTGRRDENKHLL